MTAEPLLNKVAQALAEHRLEAVMVGNAAAALHGAPVTTLDIDFMFRKTPANLKKLKAVACDYRATIFKQFYPPSDIYRLENDDTGTRVMFYACSLSEEEFEKLRSRAAHLVPVEKRIDFHDERSSLDVPRKSMTSSQELALRKESERARIDQIRRLLALPMNKRTNFLRVRRPGGGSHL